MTTCWLHHQWSRWQQYEERGTALFGILAPKAIQGKEHHYVETRQQRTCKRCGKMEDDLVRDGPTSPRRSPCNPQALRR